MHRLYLDMGSLYEAPDLEGVTLLTGVQRAQNPMENYRLIDAEISKSHKYQKSVLDSFAFCSGKSSDMTVSRNVTGWKDIPVVTSQDNIDELLGINRLSSSGDVEEDDHSDKNENDVTAGHTVEADGDGLTPASHAEGRRFDEDSDGERRSDGHETEWPLKLVPTERFRHISTHDSGVGCEELAEGRNNAEIVRAKKLENTMADLELGSTAQTPHIEKNVQGNGSKRVVSGAMKRLALAAGRGRLKK